ncbi:hypothetical protein FGE12_27905 [Aggregicoccus sp. 17bor-14]|uniref:hypothetical protein n=1 Tax=Myxococcaceae TaxID=31 RepID=UPI00129CE8E5|nr:MULTISPECIES: hypothetical protein [Myxococcaceae]MBF5046273.1 hypothetical protein [Simulacricoccus sp. 17bor-14]MRI91995.1 hypothetical protein [Aggregicoccus sp. 17bor-14]
MKATKTMLLGAALLALASGCGDDAAKQQFTVYGLKDDGRSVYSLGTWPDLSAGTTPLFDVFAPEDRQLDPDKFQIFTGGYLANDGKRLLSGYTKPDVTGKVAVHTLEGSSTQYVSIPGNFTAVGNDGTFYVSGLQGASFSSGSAVYALRDQTPQLVMVGSQDSASGPLAIATNGAAVFGYADASANYENVLPLVAPSLYGPDKAAVTSFSGPLGLSGVFDIAGFRDGIAALQGSQDPQTFKRHYDGVVRVPLKVEGDLVKTSGLTALVLRFADQCSRVSLEGSMGDDLLVRISDPQGKDAHLVRIAIKKDAKNPTRSAATDCATAQRDPVLGTLELQTGFVVESSAALPEGVGAVTAVPVAQ